MNKVIEYLVVRREALEAAIGFLGKVWRLVTKADRYGFLLPGTVADPGPHRSGQPGKAIMNLSG